LSHLLKKEREGESKRMKCQVVEEGEEEK